MNLRLKTVVCLAVVIGVAWGCLPSGVSSSCDCVAAPFCTGCVGSGGSYSRSSSSIKQPARFQHGYSHSSYSAPIPVINYPPPGDTYQPPTLSFDINELQKVNAINNYNPNPTLITSPPAYSTPQQVEVYPSEQYQKMLSIPSSFSESKVDINLPSSVSTTTIKPDLPLSRAPTNNDDTAYREGYNLESGAHFESSDITAPPPEDLEANYTDSDPTLLPDFAYPPGNKFDFATVVKEDFEKEVTKSVTDNFVTYTQQVCTGIVISKAIVSSMADVAMKCAEVGCNAANVRAQDDDVFEAIFLQRGDNRKDNVEFNCISTETVPMKLRNVMRVETDLKKTQTNRSPSEMVYVRPAMVTRAIVIRPMLSQSNRKARLETMTPKPIKVRLATIEPKSSY